MNKSVTKEYIEYVEYMESVQKRSALLAHHTLKQIRLFTHHYLENGWTREGAFAEIQKIMTKFDKETIALDAELGDEAKKRGML